MPDNDIENIEHETAFRCGHVGLCGRPNVGKSTLLNRLLDQKLSITSRKPHTTRWHVTGIKSSHDSQIIYVDMPGLKQQRSNALNRFMHREVSDGLLSVDVIVLVVEAAQWKEEDEYVLDRIKETDAPVYVVINKIDKLADKKDLLPFMESLNRKHDFEAVIPMSARYDSKIEGLEEAIKSFLPIQPPVYPDDQISDRNERFFLAEFLREQLVRHLGDELPYRLTVTIEDMKVLDDIAHIHALIWVESEGQKAIVIGEAGRKLKSIASSARLGMEKFIDKRVNLKTWVKVRDKWTNDIKSMREFGYNG